MSILDGFNLWLGKVLAELFIVFLIFAVPAALIGMLLLYAKVASMFRRARK